MDSLSFIKSALVGLSALSLWSEPLASASVLDGEIFNPGSIHSLLSPHHNITVELGIEYLHPDLPTIHHIVVENPHTSTAVTAPVQGDVKNDYPDTLAQTLKLQALLLPESNFTVGLKTYLPLSGLAQMDSGNTYQPEYVLYRAESQRPRILLLSGIDLGPDWRFGLGLDLAFSVTAEADIFLQSGTAQGGGPTVSDQRISAKVNPSLVPQASLSFHDFSFTVRGENKANFDLSTIAGARVLSTYSAGVDFSYSSQSALFYQPWQFEFLGESAVSSDFKVRYGVSYELWSGYQARAAVIRSAVPVTCPSGATDCTPQFSSGLLPAFQARNLWVPEVGFVFNLDQDRLELDYQFKDSIFTDVPRGDGNYLDPPRHDAKIGFTHHLLSGFEWNIHASVSRLTPQTVVKSDPQDIGGPNYQASGWIYGGGLSVAIPFKN